MQTAEQPLVGERGSVFQVVGIALRALFNPEVLVFDEATSS